MRTLLTIFFFIVIKSVHANEFVNIKGLINTELGAGISCSITVNEQKANCEKAGTFNLKVARSNIYQLVVESDGYYKSIHTFSDFELSEISKTFLTSNYEIEAISLVRKKQGRVMFAFGGDVMMGRRFWNPYFNEPALIREPSILADTKQILAHMKPYMSVADFAAINLESQVTKHEPKARAPKSVTFYSPPETIKALQWAGIDYVTLGNNHIYDYHDEGLIDTIRYLDDFKMPFSGAGLDQQQALRPYKTSLNGIDYSMLGFVGWEGGFSPSQVAEKNKGGSALGSLENIRTTVRNEQQAGRATIVQYHGSLEYTEEPSMVTETRLKTAIDEGADIVIAHHPHVTQGIEIYKNKLIAYSMGNFVFDQYFYETPLSYILYVWMDGENFHRAEIMPIYLKGYSPTPATGSHRSLLTKRAHYLSSKRGTNVSSSGGNLLIGPPHQPTKANIFVNFGPNEKVSVLNTLPASSIKNVRIAEKKHENRYRLGREQLNGGDFETWDLFDSAERGIQIDNSAREVEQSKSGNISLRVNVTPEKPSVVGMKTFRRVYDPANPMTFKMNVLNNKESVELKLFLQVRKTRESFKKALTKSDRILLSHEQIPVSKTWQPIEIEFNTPRVGYRSYRVIAEFSSMNKQDLLIDDISLIKWKSFYSDFDQEIVDSELSILSTHLGLEKKANAKMMLEIELNH
jgi:poly-gamma-glutamate capsule biosynthesis protein CapA/YwtB (metallophosphatase superfamily)